MLKPRRPHYRRSRQLRKTPARCIAEPIHIGAWIGDYKISPKRFHCCFQESLRDLYLLAFDRGPRNTALYCGNDYPHSDSGYRKYACPVRIIARRMNPAPKGAITRFGASVHSFWKAEKDLPTGMVPSVIKSWTEAMMSGYFASSIRTFPVVAGAVHKN